MPKVKRARRGAQKYDPLAGKPKGRDVDVDMDETKAESRGAMEKRHHRELKQWRLEEAELRRQRNKVKKGGPEATREKKRILKEIRDKDAELKERHARELKELLEARELEQKSEQPETAAADASAAVPATAAAAAETAETAETATATEDKEEDAAMRE